MNKVKVRVFNKSKNDLPEYAKVGDAGFDFKADFTYKNISTDFIGDGFRFNSDTRKLRVLGNGGRVLVPTGIFIELPDGYELQVRPRSGLALKFGISMVNTPATIDFGYTGEIGIIIINTGKTDFEITEGDRIAQGVLKRVEQVQWEEVLSVDEFNGSERGTGGFGHSGKK